MARFETNKEAWNHADDPSHENKRYLVRPLPICRKAVTGHQFVNQACSNVHWEIHTKSGHIKADEECVPQLANPLPFGSTLLLWRQIRETISRDLSKGAESFEELPDEDRDDDTDMCDSDNKEQNIWAPILGNGESIFNEEDWVLSAKSRHQIHEQNTVKWSMPCLSYILLE